MKADVVVIGAGVVGASIAYELARAGKHVVVVDRNPGPGLGSTSASSAVVRFTYSNHTSVATSWEAGKRWAKWRQYLRARDDEPLAKFHRVGFARIEAGEPRGRLIQLFSEIGIPFEVWGPTELQSRIPGIDVGSYGPPSRPDDDAFWADGHGQVNALFTPDGGYVDDPKLAAENLADAATRVGVQFVYRAAVVSVDRGRARDGSSTDGHVCGVTVQTGERFEAPIVVNAAGPWSTELNKLAGVGADFGVRVRPMRAEVHRVNAPEALVPVLDQLFPFSDLDLGTYVRPDSGGGLLVGGVEPECDPLEWIDDPDTCDPRVSQAQFETQAMRAARRFPDLTVPSRPSGVSGVYDVAEDWTPIYDKTDLPGYFVAMGTSGNQFKNAPVLGEIVTAIVLAVEGGQDHDTEPVQLKLEHVAKPIDLAAFSRLRTVSADSARSVSG